MPLRFRFDKLPKREAEPGKENPPIVDGKDVDVVELLLTVVKDHEALSAK